jgi:hypothetical protein
MQQQQTTDKQQTNREKAKGARKPFIKILKFKS